MVACSAPANDARQVAEQASKLPNSVTFADGHDPWGGATFVLGNERYLAAALHTANQLGVWHIDQKRQVTAVGEFGTTGFHPDDVAHLGGDRVVVSVEGENAYSIWSVGGDEMRELTRAGTPFGARNVKVGDFDKDGVQDLVFTPYSGDKVAIMWGTQGGYTEPQDVDAGLSAWHPVVYDWNADGIDDLLWTELDANKVRVAFGSMDRKVSAKDLYEIEGHTARQVAVGDVDGDGLADLAVAVEIGSSKVLLTRPDGEFEMLALAAESDNIGFVSAAILDKGVVAFADEGRVVLVQYQQGQLSERRYLTAGSMPSPMLTADADGDGELDLIVMNAGDNGITIHFGPVWENAQNERP